jgi:hypothetical protein
MAIWRTFLNLNLLDRAWETVEDYNGYLVRLKFKKAHQMADQVIQQNSLQRAGGP